MFIRLFSSLIVLLVVIFGFTTSVNAETCNFNRNLEVGDSGEDVKCLQKYLNNAGFIIANSGVGSPGNETNLFGALTKTALSKWQADKGISPKSGFWGPLSIAKYRSLYSSSGQETPKINEIEPIVKYVTDNEKEDALDAINKAVNSIEDAREAIDDSNVSDDEIEDAEEELEDIQKDFFEMMNIFFEGDYAEVKKRAKNIQKNTEDVNEDVGGGYEEKLEDLEDEIDNARDEIEEMEDDRYPKFKTLPLYKLSI
jgi:peptidoglycan hydrolase-like protein with peptidoglycan-binding domain